MIKRKRAVFLLFFVIGLPIFSFAEKAKKEIHLVTHEASPFMDTKLPEDGALVYALKRVFKKMDYDLKVTILDSWPRAKSKALSDPSIDGYAPYLSKEDPKNFIYSDFFFEAPWGLIERRNNPIKWKTVEDLTKYRAGNVLGVEYRADIKQLVDAGKLQVTTTSTPENNIRLLATGRVDFIFSDANTFNYEISTNKSLQEFKDLLQINAKPISISRYGLAIRKGRLPQSFIKDFNQHSGSFTQHWKDYLKLLEKTPRN